jgi:hypothetical protein
MRFRNAINKQALGILGLAVFLSACGNIRYSANKSHTFQYTRVTKNGAELFAVEKGDTMNIDREGTFNYVIKKPGKNASGTWKLLNRDSSRKNQAFEFRYAADNQIRVFEICRYNRKTLILCEGPLRFEYKRVR